VAVISRGDEVPAVKRRTRDFNSEDNFARLCVTGAARAAWRFGNAGIDRRQSDRAQSRLHSSHRSAWRAVGSPVRTDAMSDVIEREALMSPASHRGKARPELDRPLGLSRVAYRIRRRSLRGCNRVGEAPGTASNSATRTSSAAPPPGVKHLPRRRRWNPVTGRGRPRVVSGSHEPQLTRREPSASRSPRSR